MDSSITIILLLWNKFNTPRILVYYKCQTTLLEYVWRFFVAATLMHDHLYTAGHPRVGQWRKHDDDRQIYMHVIYSGVMIVSNKINEELINLSE